MIKPSRIAELTLVAIPLAVALLTWLAITPSPEPKPRHTSLHMASVFEAEAIPGLVEAGASVQSLDQNGHTPLWPAVRFIKLEAVKELLRLGADPDAGGPGEEPPLLAATFLGSRLVNGLIVEQLIAAGADVNVASLRYHESPLHYATRAGNREAVRHLLAAGAVVDARSCEDDTPLQAAVVRGDVDIIAQLLEAGADPELRNTAGFRPIDQLNVSSNPVAVQAVFRSHGADDQPRHKLAAAARRRRQ